MIDIVYWDTLRAVASVALLVLYVAFGLESVALMTLALFEISLAPVVAWAVQHFLFHIRYFGPMNIFVIFIALTVGVDDVFV
eukprot:3642677-Rhodomonas_salina.1